MSVQVLDIDGKTLDQQRVTSSQSTLTFDLSDYPNGLYMIRVTGELFSTVERVVLAK